MSNITTDTVGHYHPSPPARHVGSLQPMDMDAAWIQQHQQKSSKYYKALSFCDVTYVHLSHISSSYIWSFDFGYLFRAQNLGETKR